MIGGAVREATLVRKQGYFSGFQRTKIIRDLPVFWESHTETD
jgi:hypothetical protein